jgi:hypothetical protein
MKLVQKLTAVQARLQQLHEKFGEEQYKRIIVCKSNNDPLSGEVETSYTLLEPLPRVEFVKQSLIGFEISRNIIIQAKDLMVSEVMRTYSADFFVKDVQYFCIEPAFNVNNQISLDAKGNPIGGDFYKLVHIIDKDTTTYTLILQSIKDHYKL